MEFLNTFLLPKQQISIQKTYQFISSINGISETYKMRIFVSFDPVSQDIGQTYKKTDVFFHLTPYHSIKAGINVGLRGTITRQFTFLL